jgi:uncharacterized membrane protein YsdA (DUF1294 family)
LLKGRFSAFVRGGHFIMNLDDNEAARAARRLRAQRLTLGLLLGFCALGSSACYLVFLQNLAKPVLAALVALEFMTMIIVYYVIVIRWRGRGGGG